MKIIKKLVFILFTIMVITNITACGIKRESSNLQTKEDNAEISKLSNQGNQEEDFVYQAIFQTVKEKLSWIRSIYVKEEKVILFGSFYEQLKGEREHFYLITCDLDGSNAKKKEIPFDKDVFVKFVTIYESDDGEIKIGAITSTDNITKNQKISNTGNLFCTIDLQGKIITSCGLNTKDNNSNFYIGSNACVSKEGFFYTIVDSYIYGFDTEGNQSGVYNFGKEIYGVLPLSFKELLVLGAADNSGSTWKILDITTKKFGESHSIKNFDFFSATMRFCTENKIIIECLDSVYSLDLKSEKVTPLFSWIDFGINNMFLAFTADSKERIIAANEKTENGSDCIELSFLEKIKASEANKKVITLACISRAKESLREKIIEFNKYQEDYRIQLMDYSDYEDAKIQMNLDIASGKIPDIVCVNYAAVEQYEKKGMFTDLYSFMEQDTEIKKEDFIESVRKAIEVDGKLYYMGDTFTISALQGAKQVIGDRKSWTIEEMEEIYSRLPKNGVFMQDMRRQWFLRNFLRFRISDYMDWDTKEVSFDSKEFIKILEFSNHFPDQSENIASNENAEKEVKNGNVMVDIFQLDEFYRIQLPFTLYQDLGGFSVVGYPSVKEDETLPMQFSGTFLAITEQCKEKEIAWQFFKTLLTYEYQKSLYLEEADGLPTRIDAFETWMEYAQIKKEYIEDDGTKIIPIFGKDMFYNQKIELRPLKKKEIEVIKEMVDRVGIVSNYNENIEIIENIVLEEAESFFAGDKTAEQVAEIIQSRVKIYLSENS